MITTLNMGERAREGEEKQSEGGGEEVEREGERGRNGESQQADCGHLWVLFCSDKCYKL